MEQYRLKSDTEIETLREGGKRLAYVLEELAAAVRPGISTAELDEKARALFEEVGGSPAFLNYQPPGAPRPFPASVCVSIDEVVVHGIPTENVRTIADGDIVMLDAGLKYEGLYTDSALTVGAGNVDAAGEQLIKVAREARDAGIAAAVPGAPFRDVGRAVEEVVKPYGYGIVRELGGHGVGHSQHEPPFIANHAEVAESGTFEPGMVVAIEPIINEGKPDVVFLSDGYTVRTKDGGRSAEFEHTIAITETGPDILTKNA